MSGTRHIRSLLASSVGSVLHVLLALISIIEVGLGLVVRLWQVGAAVRYGQLPILNLAIAVASLAAGGVGLNWLRRLWRRALVARSLE